MPVDFPRDVWYVRGAQDKRPERWSPRGAHGLATPIGLIDMLVSLVDTPALQELYVAGAPLGLQRSGLVS